MRKFLFLIGVSALLVSCGSYKSLAYMQDVTSGESEAIINQYTNTVRAGDMLSIVVSSSKPELAIPYNLFGVRGQASNTSAIANVTARNELEGYTVGTNGRVDFPVLGSIEVAGMTREQISSKLKAALEGSVPDVVVTVNFINFRITVSGEVNRPGVFNIYGDRITLLEALGMAGDLTTYGRRSNVLVVREIDGVRTYAQLDLKSKEFLNSDYYYLQQNDVVYVEPISARARSTSTFVNNMPLIVSLGSLATSILTALYYFTRLNNN